MIIDLINWGFKALGEYLSAHVLTCLIPAFFIAGAIAVFINQSTVMKYFGAKANKWLAYTVASFSGAILAVCSCTILPLFAGIRQRGAGLGPAISFLYSGPAVNVLAVVYSARLLGIDLGIARGIGAVAFAYIIGLLLAFIFSKEEERLYPGDSDFNLHEEKKHPLWKITVYFAVMIVLLITASSIGLVIEIINVGGGKGELVLSGKILPTILAVFFLTATVWMSLLWYNRDERSQWMKETGKLAWKILPILLIGVFAAGIIKALLPQSIVQKWVGGNSLGNNMLASVFGALMYFSTLTEVPIVKALLDLGMGKGPALTLLLAGPSLSLPNMIVISRIIGIKRTGVYTAAVIVMSAFTGMMFGKIF